MFEDPGGRILIDLGIMEILEKGSYFYLYCRDFVFVSACILYISLWLVIHITTIVSSGFVLYTIARTLLDE
jgi:hypothetical protein